MNARHTLITFVLLLLLVPAVHAQRSDSRAPRADAGTRAVGGTNSPATSVRDGGFEGSYEPEAVRINDDWKVESSVFASPLCLETACGESPAFAGARSGTQWAYFGGTTLAETAFIEQKIVLPETGFLQLEYYMWISFSGVAPTLTVSIDSTVVDTVPTSITAGYVVRTIDLTAFADGKAHKLRFAYSKPGGGFADINIDDISLYKGEALGIFNPGFEAPLGFWTVTNQTGDKIKCNTLTKTFSYSGTCAFRFKGGIGENSKLTQQSIGLSRALPPVATRAPNAYAIYLGAFVNAPSSVRGTMKLTLTMSDATKVKTKVRLAGNGKYKWLQTPSVQYPTEQGIIAILIGLVNKSESGKTYIDDVEIFQVGVYFGG